MNKLKLVCLLFFFCNIFNTKAQEIAPNLLYQRWDAQWIAHQNTNLTNYGVFHFRKNFDLKAKPTKFIIHLSADNRYRLFVNGNYVSAGPARSDAMHWNFETIDIAEQLKVGKNTISVAVWNFSDDMPWSQMSRKTGFILQGNSPVEAVLNTDKSWKVAQNMAYKPIPVDGGKLQTFIVVGAGEEIDASKYPYGWEKPEYDDAKWNAAVTLEHGYPSGVGSGATWYLVPRTIPQMEEKYQPIKEIRRFTGIADELIKDSFLKGSGVQVIPANSKVTILLDQTFETVAYPEMTVSGGKGSSVQLTYAEALMNEKREKGNRNDISGKKIMGNIDIFRTDGQAKRTFRPLWFRTFRYIELQIETKAEPLTINSLYGIYTGYPFEEKASFKSTNDPSLKGIWDTGYRTARLCAGETYFDCPYYEQLQYTGDTRIQALISLYVTGDDRLMRKAIQDYDNSTTAEGLTQARYPSNITQIIPTFSLFWVSMVYDYWMHRKDDKFVKSFTPNIERVLTWYERKIDPKKNMLGTLSWWCFVDWAKPWAWDNVYEVGGVPEGVRAGNSSIITFQYVYTLRQASAIFESYGEKEKANYYKTLADLLGKSTFEQCFDATRGVVADSPLKKDFSQHASIMAILSGAVPKNQEQALMEKILSDQSLIQATFYFKFYQTQALKRVGLAERYHSTLMPWRDMIKEGLTTFAENPEPTRSDCHAWSASPNYDFLATICGIMPEAPGFEEVRIQPALGILDNAEGKMPHPWGEISVKLNRKGKGISAEIILPEKLIGKFIWNGKITKLTGGKQTINEE